MKSFQEIYTELQDQSGDSAAAQLTIFKRHINDTQQIVLGNHSWKFLESTFDITTIASTGSYDLPGNLGKIRTVVTLDSNGQVDQLVEVVEDPVFWEEIIFRNSSASDLTQYAYREGNELLIWPDFSTAGLTIRVRGRKDVIGMSRADYTTGTIAAATNASKTITGTGTPAWTARKPVGEQWLRIDQTTGDYRWYKVASIDSDTQITLDTFYVGTTFAAATQAYTLGEFPVIPSKFQNLLFYRPMALYYMKIESPNMANMYWNLYDGGYEMGRIKRPAGMLGALIKHEAGALDAKYFPPQGQARTPRSPEFLAKDTTSTLG